MSEKIDSELLARIRAVQKLTGNRQRWTLPDGRVVNLLSSDELEGLQRELPRTQLISINGDVVRAADAAIEYSIFGYTIYGLLQDVDMTPNKAATGEGTDGHDD